MKLRYLAVLTISAAFCAQALGTSGHLSAFRTRYNIAQGSNLNSCITCHMSAPPVFPFARNLYGQDLDEIGNQVSINVRLQMIEPIDSDGDTVINFTEITVNGTFSGDPTSVPTATTVWGEIKALFQ
jgi:hypothetical protein